MKNPLFYLALSVILGCSNNPQVRLIEDAVDTSAGNLSCFKIETPTAIYFLEKEGAGLSSMIDREGIDWIRNKNQKRTKEY